MADTELAGPEPTQTEQAEETGATQVTETTQAPEPKAPETTEAAPASRPEQTAQERRRAIQQEIRERFRKPLEAGQGPTEGEKAQPRDEKGRYAPKEGEQEEGGEEAEETTAEATSEVPPEEQEASTEEGAAAETPATEEGAAEELVELDVPEGHWLRDMGKEKLPPMPKEWEESLRGMLNDHARRGDVQTAMQRATQAEDRLAQLEAELTYIRENPQVLQRGKKEDDPVYKDLLQAYGPEQAERYWNGQNPDAELDQVRQEAVRERQVEAVKEYAENFKRAAMIDALGSPQHGVQARYPNWTADAVQQHLRAYGSLVNAEGKSELTAQDWYSFADAAYQRQHPKPQADPKQIKAEVEQEAKKREEERLKDAARRHADNPNRALSRTSTGHRTPEAETPERDRNKSAGSLKKEIGKEVRDLVRQTLTR